MQNNLLPIDTLFADKIFLQAPEKAANLLAFLLQRAREGHLCIDISLDEELKEGERLLPETIYGKYLVKEGSKIYLRRNWECQSRFVNHLNRIMQKKPALEIAKEDLEKELEIFQLQDEQARAILLAASQSLTLISGGPGTGKTYTAAALIRSFLNCGIKHVVVTAPTGKAAANLRSAVPEECQVNTLHSLLKKTRLYADLVLVDEGAMVDAEMMAALFQAMPEGSRLVLLGDKDQLPPVESGNFFAELSRVFSLVAELRTCLRAELQDIVELGRQVKNGNTIPYSPLPELKSLISLLVESKAYILTPLRKGLYGVENLNRQLYQEHKKRGNHQIPIMIAVNDPALGLFNGDTGILDVKEGMALFKNGKTFPEYLLPRYEYAYVISVHKSQGSEGDDVLVLLPNGAEIFGREMLYTAITRAKKSVTLLAEEGVVEKLVQGHSQRLSGLNLT